MKIVEVGSAIRPRARGLKIPSKPPFWTFMQPMQRMTYAPAAPPRTILTIGCRGALLDRCRRAASTADVEVQAGDVRTIATTAASLRPLALVLSRDTYAFDPEGFDALAEAVGAVRLVVEDHEPIARIVAQLVDVVSGADAIATARSPSARPSRSRARNRSGLRWRAS